MRCLLVILAASAVLARPSHAPLCGTDVLGDAVLTPPPAASEQAQVEEELFEEAGTLIQDVDRLVAELARARKKEGDRQTVRQRLHSLAARSDDLYAQIKTLHQARWAEVIFMVKDDQNTSGAGRPRVDLIRRMDKTRSRLHISRDKALHALKEDDEILGKRQKELEDRKLRAQRTAHARGSRIRAALFFGVLGVCLLGAVLVGSKLRP